MGQVCRELATRYPFPPSEIADMTIPQAEIYLADDGDRDDDGGTSSPRTKWFDSPAQANAWRRQQGFT